MAEPESQDQLPAPYRLALAYAPRVSRGQWRALLELDHRLGQLVRQAREPILAQLRLAWWRDRLREAPESRPKGQPTLALLACWAEQSAALVALVDGWEAMLADPPQPLQLAQARGEAMAALAELLGEASAIATIWQAAIEWSLTENGQETDRKSIILPRKMKPLAVLHAYEQYRRSGISGLLRMSYAILSNR